MSKSAIYTVNSNSQAVTTAGSILNLGAIVRRYGCNLNLNNNAIVTSGAGYYDVNANVTFAATADGTATIQLYKNGLAIPGAISTITVATGTTYSVAIPAIVRNICCNASSITIGVAGANGSVSNVAIVVSKM